MPLSPAKPRKHVHTRQIKCEAFQRDDGLWDVEGLIMDTKSYSFENSDREGISAGEPIHKMRVRITVTDDMEVKEAEAITEAGPYSVCGNIAPDYQKLVGLRIGPGWRKQVRQRLGGVHGCTHISDLVLGPLAVTAFQAIVPIRGSLEKQADSGERPLTLNTCHALSATSPIVKRRWPAFYTEPSAVDD